MNKHKYPYRWKLSDGYPGSNGLNVFGTFICGGGSTMGYKLAGFNHLGGVEIDPKIADVYKANHNPKYLYVEDIREFNKRTDLPDELYNLDLLDGSPPCSSFSMAGNREKDWGKKKVFKEGQSLQTLDDLFFDYIALAKKLQPKVVLAENVKGLIQGNAKSYVHKIKAGFEDAGYKVQLFLLNAASMGVPQKRERVFFICQRNDLNLPKLVMKFSEKAINFGSVRTHIGRDVLHTESGKLMKRRIKTDKSTGDINMRLFGKLSGFTILIVQDNDICPTITSGAPFKFRGFDGMDFSDKDYISAGSFPSDFKFLDNYPRYIIGMSVPPIMTAQIANQIYLQWFKLKT